MSIFNSHYARYYDTMYASKEYEKETTFIKEGLKKFGVTTGSIVSLGAGTLNHEIGLAASGFRIQALDLSPEMVSMAQQKIQQTKVGGVEVAVGDLRELHTPESPYDAAIMMFNVLSYLPSVEDVKKMFEGVAASLRPQGLFLFDCWNAEAMLHEPPQSRWKKFTSGDSELYRLTEVTPHGESAATLRIELIEIKNGIQLVRSEETHTVRSWHLSQLVDTANQYGFELVHSCVFPEWEQPVSATQWSMALLFRKKG